MKNIRQQFPILQKRINGKPLVYFDNAATTQKPKRVLAAIQSFYENANSNVHRSLNPLDEEATELFEGARKKIARFINAADSQEIIFTRNATESLNIIAKSFARSIVKKGDAVLLAITEHHSNIVPWLELKHEMGIEILYIPLDKSGRLDVAEAKKMLANSRVKIFSIAHASNALGIIHPIRDLIKIAREKNIVTVVDAAQSVAHMAIDVQNIDCDFLVFSGHKMYGPTGIGVLWGRRELLEKMPPFLGGGEMIREVSQEAFTVKEAPWKFEAGTPHIAGAIGLGEAIEFLQSIGWEKVQNIENELKEYLFRKIKELPYLVLYGPKDTNNHLALATFTLPDIHAHDVADILGEEGVCIRAGHHCTMPLHSIMKINATSRASLALYNTKEEIDIFIDAVKKVYKKFR